MKWISVEEQLPPIGKYIIMKDLIRDKEIESSLDRVELIEGIAHETKSEWCCDLCGVMSFYEFEFWQYL